jgi:hypothetical protein
VGVSLFKPEYFIANDDDEGRRKVIHNETGEQESIQENADFGNEVPRPATTTSQAHILFGPNKSIFQ